MPFDNRFDCRFAFGKQAGQFRASFANLPVYFFFFRGSIRERSRRPFAFMC